jgi:hypothetical protein
MLLELVEKFGRCHLQLENIEEQFWSVEKTLQKILAKNIKEKGWKILNLP